MNQQQLCNRYIFLNTRLILPLTRLRTIRFINNIFISIFLFFAYLSTPWSSTAYAHDVETIPPHKHQDIRIVMAAAFVSESGVMVYDEIFKYLAGKLHKKVNFISGFSYETINKMLDSGMADVGFVCGLPYTLKHDVQPPKVELLAAPIMKHKKYHDKPEYYSYIIVNKDSNIKSFAEAKGMIFAYNDEISNSGYNMPRAYMIETGHTGGFFSKVIRSGSHEESIRLVATKAADISAVDSLVYDYDMSETPGFVSQTKIITVLGPAGIPPVVVSTKLSSRLKKEIRMVLLNMHKDPVGRRILSKALVDRFSDVSDSNYDGIRKMTRMAEKANFKIIK